MNATRFSEGDTAHVSAPGSFEDGVEGVVRRVQTGESFDWCLLADKDGGLWPVSSTFLREGERDA